MIIPLGCERARSRVVDVNGLRLHFLESGPSGAPPICFLHGGAAHAHWFDAVTPAFSDRFHVVSLDQRGHGESAWAEPPAYGTEDFTGDLVGLMDVLGWARMIVVGHSMGGHNAMTFAAWHPERVAALVIVDSRPAIPAERLTVMHARGRRIPRVHPSEDVAVQSFRLLPRETVADRALLAHVARAGLMRRDGGWAWRFDPATHGARQPVDAWPLLPRITAPTLITRAALSPVLTQDMAERLRASVPRASLVTIPGAYHHLTLDRPAEFSAALSTFLSTL
ncbi:MAG TPA: alpha/beta hydrolase [Patescibacteria group bacterium]|jgi:pimeloyl-ACP methyl ester carboxylesterase|nr:alpha/beta hydrolase [Patescibacteria group bacterium]